ncbi:hypothetical protein [Peribacillus kribbensis]|uniref:hypothetical protein n=1 Tax=Peribacillus kribbensis TaxID=356658 RepID=UPI000406ACE9|nr:hypothetical protein [Peribacillus kribbensis]
MKVSSTWKKNTYLFDFFVASVTASQKNSEEKMAAVTTSVYTQNKTLLWSGEIRVKFNQFGIYPLPEDLSAISLPESIIKMLLVEIRRYIKPQKAFL